MNEKTLFQEALSQSPEKLVDKRDQAAKWRNTLEASKTAEKPPEK